MERRYYSQEEGLWKDGEKQADKNDRGVEKRYSHYFGRRERGGIGMKR